MTTFKLQYQEEVRRASYDSRTTSWDTFRTSVGQLFTIPADTITAVRYTDSDGDLITLNSDLELTQLLQQYAQASAPLKIIVVTSSTSSPAASAAANHQHNTKMDDSPIPPPSSSSSTSSSSSSGQPEVNVDEILKCLGPFEQIARQVLESNPALKEEAERFAKAMASGEHPPAPPCFSGFAGPGAGAGAGFPFGGGAHGFPFAGGFPGGFANHPPRHHFHPQAQQPSTPSPTPTPQQFRQPQPQPQPQEGGNVYAEQLKELASMGFIDEGLNRQLLAKYRGDVEKVLLEIFWLQQQAEAV